MPASPEDEVDRTSSKRSVHATTPVKVGRRAHTHRVPVKPSRPKVY